MRCAPEPLEPLRKTLAETAPAVADFCDGLDDPAR